MYVLDFVCAQAGICTYVTVLFSKLVAMVANSLKSLC